ncbi:MAG TPA: hypothetical protein PLH20_07135, partial [Flavobacterium sp.]|nr:hypothetical protein [Flavobacterium sp.]
MNDNSIGGLVVCDSSDQAKMLFEIFESKYAINKNVHSGLLQAAEPQESYGDKKKAESKVTKAAVIL